MRGSPRRFTEFEVDVLPEWQLLARSQTQEQVSRPALPPSNIDAHLRHNPAGRHQPSWVPISPAIVDFGLADLDAPTADSSQRTVFDEELDLAGTLVAKTA